MTHDGSVHALMRTTNTLWIYQSQLIDNQFRKLLNNVTDVNQSAGFQFCIFIIFL